MRLIRIIIFVGLAFVLSGCATNGYSAFYTQNPYAEIHLKNRESPPPTNPIIEKYAASSTEEMKAAVNRVIKRGYMPIGESSFHAEGNQSERNAINQGIKVGADLVLIMHPRYMSARQTSVPVSVPTRSTSSFTGTVYGSRSSTNAHVSGTATTYGSRTTYVPMTFHRRAYAAAYFVKINPKLGVTFREINDEERQLFQTNKGLRVDLVYDDSPAYRADIIPGDVLLSVNETPIGMSNIFDILMQNSGQSVVIEIYRRGRIINKRITLN